MKRSMATLATVVLATLSTLSPASSANFGQKEVDQNKFIAVASPYGGDKYQLFIYEQISDKQECWRENGTTPTQVDLLLLNFDFTGICGRMSDSNGYSIRQASRDLGWEYDLAIVKRGDELVLEGTHFRDRNASPIEIGRSYGITDGFIKIHLNPEWRLTKRTYADKTLGHVYFTSDDLTASINP